MEECIKETLTAVTHAGLSVIQIMQFDVGYSQDYVFKHCGLI